MLMMSKRDYIMELALYNLDDYHDIHEKRRPDTVTLSTAKYMATCICKQVSACVPIPINFNNKSIHNHSKY